MKYKIIIITVSILILSLIFYNLYKKNNVENFESVLSKMKSKNSNSKNSKTKYSKEKYSSDTNDDTDDTNDDANDENISKNITKNLKKSLNSLKSKKTGTTFEDLLNETEQMNPEKYTLANIHKSLSDYSKSFKKEKFNNNSKNTAESFEKFAFYKEKFFEIFN
jgi:cytoskeletal protein RodZ